MALASDPEAVPGVWETGCRGAQAGRRGVHALRVLLGTAWVGAWKSAHSAELSPCR